MKVPHLATAPVWKDCLVHRGFQGALMAVYDEVVEAVSEIQQSQCSSLWFTGHSLGGAMATLLAAEYRVMYSELPIALCTFGSPRVGNERFASCYKNLVQ